MKGEMTDMYDVIIIGEEYPVLHRPENCPDIKSGHAYWKKRRMVCCGTSKANSAIAHAGYDAEPGSLMAKLNVRGNEMMEQLSKDLDFPFQRIGSLVICLSEEEMPGLQKLYDKGIANGVKGPEDIKQGRCSGDGANITDNVYAALYAPTAGIVCHLT